MDGAGSGVERRSNPRENYFNFDDPIRSREHVRRNREADLFYGFQIDDQLKLELATRRAAKSIGLRL